MRTRGIYKFRKPFGYVKGRYGQTLPSEVEDRVYAPVRACLANKQLLINVRDESLRIVPESALVHGCLRGQQQLVGTRHSTVKIFTETLPSHSRAGVTRCHQVRIPGWLSHFLICGTVSDAILRHTRPGKRTV